eukprot:5317015-Prymnesium_polylepis.1
MQQRPGGMQQRPGEDAATPWGALQQRPGGDAATPCVSPWQKGVSSSYAATCGRSCPGCSSPESARSQ